MNYQLIADIIVGFLALVAEQLIGGGIAGIILALAIYLPLHNRIWGRV